MEVKEITKEIRKASLTYKTEPFSMLKTSDGRLFEKKIQAEKHQKKINILEDFRKTFSEERGNFVSAPLDMVELMVGTEESPDNIVEHFWIKIDKDEDRNVLFNTLYDFYSVPKGSSNQCMKDFGWYLFIMIRREGRQNTIKTFNESSIGNRVNIIKNSLPSILMKSNNVQVTAEIEKTHGYLLDFTD